MDDPGKRILCHLLSSFEREELIALIVHLKNELRKKDRRKNNCNTKGGRSREEDTSPVCDQKLVPVKHEFEKSVKQLKTKNKLTVLSNGTEKELRAKIIKICADDEVQRTTVSTVKMTESPKVAASVEKSEPNADDCESGDNSASTQLEITVGTKIGNLTEGQAYSFGGTENVLGRPEDEDRVSEQKEHVSETMQRKWEKYEDSEDRADEHPMVEDNKDECIEISNDVADDKFIKGNVNDCSEVQECSEEEEPTSDTQQQLEKMTSMKKIGQEDEIRFGNAERGKLKKNEVTSNFVSRSILRTTSAHLKRLELLIAKTSSCSSSP
ncbi:hypothetical protein LOAG_03587 [Loa loa]|uniref:Uncharacterized protein n=1 Tax=Loa loa TaxID=7209 RepID=A0A1S0U3T5_LOALO|nr:hypothetical protein LOAG_03587 [Loa loa]EFO24897.1 hypothetical protein LOAG_03587 [Loa loa]